MDSNTMPWYEDFAPYGELGTDCLRTIGWLERGRPFTTGAVDHAVYVRLVELLRHPWEPYITMGFHRCDLCLYEGPTGKRNLYLPADEFVFVAPELVTHYMNAHGYRPPDEFCTAVLMCPEMRSAPYFKALLKTARQLVQAAVTTRYAEPDSSVEGGDRT